MNIPERFFWAAELMDIQPDDNILEIGCGAGLLAELLATRLERGKLIGVDRSPEMISKAEKRNADYIASGISSFMTSDFLKARLQDSFFKNVVAFNVNFFFKDPSNEFVLIRKCLKQNGKLFIFHQAPYEIDISAADPIKTNLEANRFKIVDVAFRKLQPTSAVCIIAQPA